MGKAPRSSLRKFGRFLEDLFRPIHNLISLAGLLFLLGCGLYVIYQWLRGSL